MWIVESSKYLNSKQRTRGYMGNLRIGVENSLLQGRAHQLLIQIITSNMHVLMIKIKKS